MNKNTAPQTAAVHNHEVHDTISNGVNMPIFASSAFKYEKGTTNRYPRYYNSENERSLIAKLSALEHTENGFLMSSGMAAISTALLGLLQPGNHALFQEQLYGGTLHLLHHELKRLGIEYSLVKGGSVADFQAAMQPNTKLLYLETPSNPLLQVLDLKALGKWAKEQKLLSLIDNTFASPVNQNPADFGIDVILHSGTKYLGGHSDLCFGALLTSNELRERLFPTAIALGGSLNPMDLYLIDRSLKTLYVRVAQQNKNAQALAEWLLKQEQVAKVNYPGLPSHPQHHIAQQQMRGFGGMLSFQLATDAPAEMAQFLKKLSLIVPAISLGGVETICSVPADTSHNKISAEARAEAGISDFLVRLSVGVEAVEDLQADLKQALAVVQPQAALAQ
jgi:cystathionine beta-lyase